MRRKGLNVLAAMWILLWCFACAWFLQWWSILTMTTVGTVGTLIGCVTFGLIDGNDRGRHVRDQLTPQLGRQGYRWFARAWQPKNKFELFLDILRGLKASAARIPVIAETPGNPLREGPPAALPAPSALARQESLVRRADTAPPPATTSMLGSVTAGRLRPRR